jgi:hypothetical protein
MEFLIVNVKGEISTFISIARRISIIKKGICKVPFLLSNIQKYGSMMRLPIVN